jgi:16S rRNA C1402 (ribose-2'-O) methylase RsmI
MEKLLEELREYGFQGKISISREISKIFEQHLTGTLEEITELFKNGTIQIKGEFVIGIKRD